MSLFCGTTDTPVLDFWWRHAPGFKPGWICHLHASSTAHNGCLRFTSDVTPAKLLMANMAPDRIPHLHVAEVGCQDVIIFVSDPESTHVYSVLIFATRSEQVTWISHQRFS